MCGGEEYSVSRIVAECASCRAMFFSGGGVTFTGGEATLQKDELVEILAALRAEGINTALETNGTSPHLCEISRYVDYLIMDFKHYDSEILKRHTGVGNEILKKNFESNCKAGLHQHIRIPLINGFNADSPRGFAEYFSLFDTKNTCFEFFSI